MKSPAIKYGIAAVLTLGLLYLAFRGQDLSAAWSAASQAHVVPLLVGVLLMFLSHAVRALRWTVVMRPLKQKMSFVNAFKATLAGYGMNNLIPRSGEIARPYLMAKSEQVPMAGVLASVVVERLTDVVALIALIGFSLAEFNAPLVAAFPMLQGWTIPALVAMLLALGMFVAIFFSETRTRAFASLISKPFGQKLKSKIAHAASDFSKGLQGLDRSAILPLTIGTIGIWGLYGLSMFVSLRAFDGAMSQIGLAGAFMLLTLSGISFTIPTPGASGTYHMFISRGLFAVFAIAMPQALAYAVITHALSFVSMIIVGGAIVLREGLSMKKLTAPAMPVPEPSLAID